MRPITTRSTATIEAPAAFAWAYLRDYENDLRWRTGLSRMSQTPPGPVVAGASVEESLRVLGRQVDSVVEVGDVVEGRSFTWRVVAGATASGSRTVTPDGADRCRLEMVKHVVLTGSDRLARPVVALAVRRAERGDAARAAACVEAAWRERPVPV